MEGKEFQKHRTKLKSTPFFAIGLTVALSLTLVAFEYRQTSDADVIFTIDEEIDPFEDELVEVPIVKLPEPPKPRIEKPIIKKTPPLPTPVVEPVIVSTTFKVVDNKQKIDDELVLPAFADSSVFQYEDEKEEVVLIPEIYPEFPGGESGMLKYLAENIKFTRMAIDGNISGKVYVEFIVGKNGKVREVKLVRGLGFGLDEVALGAIENMPKWKPGRQNGERVGVKYTIPVNFILK